MVPESFFRSIAPISRGLLALIFLISGFTKVPQWSATTAMMAERGMGSTDLFLVLAVLIEVIAGALLLTGNRARLAAGMLFLYLIPVTLIFHNFWTYPAAEQQLQAIMLLKNLALMGGLLHVVSLGAGAFSIDSLREAYSPETPAKAERPKLRRVS